MKKELKTTTSEFEPTVDDIPEVAISRKIAELRLKHAHELQELEALLQNCPVKKSDSDSKFCNIDLFDVSSKGTLPVATTLKLMKTNAFLV